MTKTQQAKKFWTKNLMGENQIKICCQTFTVSQLREGFWTISETYENFATEEEAKRGAVVAAENALGFACFKSENEWKVW